MSINSEIRDGIIEIIRKAHILNSTSGSGSNAAFSAAVTAVDITTRSCTVTSISNDVGMTYNNVWLMPQVDDGILYIPTVGSTVIVANNANLQPYVVMWSEIDKILYIVGDTEIQMVDGTATIAQGDMQVILSNNKIQIMSNGISLYGILKSILDNIKLITVNTGAGVSDVPNNAEDFTENENDLGNLMF